MSDPNYIGPPRLLDFNCEVKQSDQNKKAHCLLNLSLEKKSVNPEDKVEQVKLELSKSSLAALVGSLEKVKSHFDSIAGHQSAGVD
ncbi:Hypothetical protein NTJ_15673 [Nesidiocoris tenuis]|uniref:COMM domain-containing protein n=1 Tax=Nesidiocoris tenuis TaxID=355587 RepID=A0ABN7BGN1_9HEMI|nr:Hypothetical protein NTJ_15673 [Nesidiocoris tenuis]